MALHLKIQGSWPTNSDDPFFNLSCSNVTSQISQMYDCIPVEVHPDHPATAFDVKLMTASAASVICQWVLTPKNSLVPAKSLVATRSTSLPQGLLPITVEQSMHVTSLEIQSIWEREPSHSAQIRIHERSERCDKQAYFPNQIDTYYRLRQVS